MRSRVVPLLKKVGPNSSGRGRRRGPASRRGGGVGLAAAVVVKTATARRVGARRVFERCRRRHRLGGGRVRHGVAPLCVFPGTGRCWGTKGCCVFFDGVALVDPGVRRVFATRRRARRQAVKIATYCAALRPIQRAFDLMHRLRATHSQTPSMRWKILFIIADAVSCTDCLTELDFCGVDAFTSAAGGPASCPRHKGRLRTTPVVDEVFKDFGPWKANSSIAVPKTKGDQPASFWLTWTVEAGWHMVYNIKGSQHPPGPQRTVAGTLANKTISNDAVTTRARESTCSCLSLGALGPQPTPSRRPAFTDRGSRLDLFDRHEAPRDGHRRARQRHPHHGHRGRHARGKRAKMQLGQQESKGRALHRGSRSPSSWRRSRRSRDARAPQ